MENLNTFPEGWKAAIESLDFLPEGVDPNALMFEAVIYLFRE